MTHEADIYDHMTNDSSRPAASFRFLKLLHIIIQLAVMTSSCFICSKRLDHLAEGLEIESQG